MKLKIQPLGWIFFDFLNYNLCFMGIRFSFTQEAVCFYGRYQVGLLASYYVRSCVVLLLSNFILINKALTVWFCLLVHDLPAAPGTNGVCRATRALFIALTFLIPAIK
jgi:hypothetical protein